MRLLELQLRAFGSFTGVALDLSGGDRGLHVVYGPNEAGKSTCLRALEAFFYGIAAQCEDGFLHDYKDLRIGARLLDEEGRELELVRRKGRKNTLLDAGGRPVPEADLERLLGGLGKELFSTLFGLDHEALVRGGSEILEGRGEVGETLFAAALGGAGPRRLIEALESEQRDLYLPQGQKPLVNRSLLAYRAALRRVNETSLTPAQWDERRRALERAEERVSRIGEEIARLRAERRFLDRLRETIVEMSQALDSVREMGAELGAIESRLAHLDQPRDILDHEKRILELHGRLDAFLKAEDDRPLLERSRREHLGRAERLARGLGEGSLERIASGAVGVSDEAAIDERGRRAVHLEERSSELEAELEEARCSLERARASLAAAPEIPSPRELASRVELVIRQGDLEQAHAEALEESSRRGEEARLELERLPLWEGEVRELEELSLAGDETVDRFERALGEAESELGSIEGKMELARARREESEGRLRVLRLGGPVPSERDLEDARGRRDALWKELVESLTEGSPSSPVARGGTEDLLGRYELAVAQADEVSDRLRREASRVAEYAALEVQESRSAAELDALAVERERATERLDELRRRWLNAWKPLGREPLSPREMREWLRCYRRVLERAGEERAAAARAEALRRRIAALRDELAVDLVRAAASPPSAEESLESLAVRARARIEELVAAERGRAESEREVRSLEEKVGALESRLTACREELEEARRGWREAVSALGQGELTPSQAAAVLDEMREIRGALERAGDQERRIAEIDAYTESFREASSRLTRAVAADLADVSPADAAARLRERLDQARQEERLRDELEPERERKARKLQEMRRRLHATGERLKGLTESARFSALRDGEAAGAAELVSRVVEAASPESVESLPAVDDLVARCNAVLESDVVGERGAHLDARLEELEEERLRLSGEAAGARRDVETEGSGAAAEASELAQVELARMRGGVERYVRLKVAGTLLRRAIERYREENQGPVLARASALFAELTAGSFRELRTGFDERDRPVLLGARASGEEVAVAGMSRGTRDQLYLALRLATLERHVEVHSPLPLVVDDLLVHFDEERSRAALRILAELSERTQVILFTHHEHVVDLASQSAPPGTLFCPRLGEGSEARAAALS